MHRIGLKAIVAQLRSTAEPTCGPVSGTRAPQRQCVVKRGINTRKHVIVRLWHILLCVTRLAHSSGCVIRGRAVEQKILMRSTVLTEVDKTDIARSVTYIEFAIVRTTQPRHRATLSQWLLRLIKLSRLCKASKRLRKPITTPILVSTTN